MNIQMPQLGETVTEGTISKWHKKVGETVKSGEILFEIETHRYRLGKIDNYNLKILKIRIHLALSLKHLLIQ